MPEKKAALNRTKSTEANKPAKKDAAPKKGEEGATKVKKDSKEETKVKIKEEPTEKKVEIKLEENQDNSSSSPPQPPEALVTVA